MPSTRRASISQQLTRMNMLVSGAALLLAGVAFVTDDVISFRAAMVESLSVQAQIGGSNTISAVTFDDPGAATKTLALLAASPNIVAADVYTSNGRPFASYRRDGDRRPAVPLAIPDGQVEINAFSPGAVRLSRRLMSGGRSIGIVALESDLGALYRRLRHYLALAAGVILTALLLALGVSRLAQRSTSRPLAEVAQVARCIADGNDYSLRATVGRGASHELATLAETFNSMLAGIQARDRSLQQSHDELEDRVQLRTGELNVSNRELEAFSYSVSHDLRAPLRHVTGFASMLERHAAATLDDTGRRYVKTIMDAADRMGRLIDDLLAFSRIGRAPLTKRRVDLAALVREAQAEVTDPTNGRPVAWEVGPLPVVNADPALLRPLLVNLLSNAVKYSSTRALPRVEVGTVEPSNGHVVLFVRDNGVGFDMAYVDKLFGVFQRLHRAEDFPGTGIGLAHVRRIIQRHGGQAWAEGAVDGGATFYVSLPVVAHLSKKSS